MQSIWAILTIISKTYYNIKTCHSKYYRAKNTDRYSNMTKKPLTINSVQIPATEQLRIASFNMLNSPYQHQTRLNMLIEEINQTQPDILCLQEVNLTETPKTLETIKKLTHLKNITHIKPVTTAKGILQANATLTNIGNTTSQEINLHLPHATGNIINALHSTLTYNHKTIHIINVHLYWGGENEHYRYQQIQKILHHLKPTIHLNPKDIIILAGDFNSNPESMTIQHLKGNLTLPNTEGTYWTDASHTTTLETKTTTNAQSILGYKTATGVGIQHPQLIPERQIDYIMVKGFAHGREGTPLTYHKCATKTNNQGLTISDHHGIFTDVYIPEN